MKNKFRHMAQQLGSCDHKKMSREFALGAHEGMGNLFTEMMSEEFVDDVPPAVVIMTPAGCIVAGDSRAISFAFYLALKDADIRNIVTETILAADASESAGSEASER